MIAQTSRRRLAAATAAILIGAVPVTIPSVAQEREPDRQAIEAAPHDQALRLLGEALAGSVEATQSDPSIPSILEALDRNIESTRRIRELAANSETLTDEQMTAIATEVTEIARSFREIADMAPDVFRRRWQQLTMIEAIGDEVGFRIADARAAMERLRRDNQRIQQELRTETRTEAQIEKDRLTQQANDAELNSLEAAVAAWTYFSDRHGEITDKMGDQSEDLDVFFHALKENARVYEAASQTLNLANSLKLALSDLESVQALDETRAALVDSWGDLMKIVDEVNNGLILQPGM
jgi:hypothetical protein